MTRPESMWNPSEPSLPGMRRGLAPLTSTGPTYPSAKAVIFSFSYCMFLLLSQVCLFPNRKNKPWSRRGGGCADTYICEYVADAIRGIRTGKYRPFPKQKFLRLFSNSRMVPVVLWLTRVLSLQMGIGWDIWMRPKLQNPKNRDRLLLSSSVPYRLS